MLCFVSVFAVIPSPKGTAHARGRIQVTLLLEFLEEVLLAVLAKALPANPVLLAVRSFTQSWGHRRAALPSPNRAPLAFWCASYSFSRLFRLRYGSGEPGRRRARLLRRRYFSGMR